VATVKKDVAHHQPASKASPSTSKTDYRSSHPQRGKLTVTRTIPSRSPSSSSATSSKSVSPSSSPESRKRKEPLTAPPASKASSRASSTTSSKTVSPSPLLQREPIAGPSRSKRSSSSASGNQLQSQDFEAEKILAKRTHRGKVQYRVKWVGWEDNECTWEPIENLANCEKPLEDFKKEQEEQKKKAAEKEWEVEKILKRRIHAGVVQYLVKWVGWPDHASTWEPKEHLANCAELLEKFNEKWLEEKSQRKSGPGRGYTNAVMGVQKKRAKYSSDGEDEEEET